MPLDLSGLFIPGQGQKGALEQATDLFKLKQLQQQGARQQEALGLDRERLNLSRESGQRAQAQLDLQRQEAEQVAHGQKIIAARDKFNASPAGSPSRQDAISEFAPLIGLDPTELRFIPQKDLEKRIDFVFKEGAKVAQDAADGKIDDRATYDRYNLLISTLRRDVAQFGSGYSQASIGQGGVQEFAAAPGALGQLGPQYNEIQALNEARLGGVKAGATARAQEAARTTALRGRLREGLIADPRRTALTDAEKKVLAFEKALQGGNELQIQATAAAVEKVGDDSGMVVMTMPDGSTVVGTGSAAAGALTQATRTRLQADIDNTEQFIAAADALTDVAGKNTLGIRGLIKGTIQDLTQTVSGAKFISTLQATADALAPYADDEGRALLSTTFDSNVPATRALSIITSAMVAHMANPDGRISDHDMKTGQIAVGANGVLANPKRLRASLDSLRRMARARIAQSQKKLRNAAKQETALAKTVRGRLQEHGMAPVEPIMVPIEQLTKESFQDLTQEQKREVLQRLKERNAATR